MNNFSFNFNQTSAKGGQTPQGDRKRPVTQGQIKYYMDLCVQKRVTPKNYVTMSYDELALEIDELRKFYPASEGQLKMIVEKITLLNQMGIEIKMLTQQELNQLTGGRGGTASVLIENLIKMERESADKMPPTDPQLEFLVSMYLCPDVNFEENFDISRRIDLGNGLWRRPTPQEFAEQIKSKMNRKDASKFIDDSRGAFHTWKQTRIRPEQMRYIRELEDRMSSLESPKTIEWAVGLDGQMIKVEKHSDKGNNYNPTAYTPLEEMQLMMFSVEEASKYIDILKSELGRKELYRYGEVSDARDTFEEIRKPKTEKGKMEKEYTALQDLVFKLEAVAGYESEGIHEAITYNLVNGTEDEIISTNKEMIREFMMYLLNEEYITFEAMVELCKDSVVAQNILMGK